MKLLVLVIAFVLLSACTASYLAPEDSNFPTRRYKTEYRIEQESIVFESLYKGIEDVEFVVYRADNNMQPKMYDAFIRSTLEKLGFKKVLNEEQFAKLLIDTGVSATMNSSEDLISLNNAYKQLGDFVVIQTLFEHNDGAYWRNRITILDPRIPKKIVKVHEYRKLWADSDSAFLYPTANYLKGWYNRSRLLK
ncbi:hypothetical protein EZV61_06925 [Corallincola luteus]|uniref:Lipoprotein n=1 Tax=Corallincola luteus TaxID=1775177 RepID=A0ABY2ALU0_9GAMM|nr:hypothetical protein [Corallincola luteus]TCI03922.1 hypothetical protein EZV61_06925 [Corallincola luteus]